MNPPVPEAEILPPAVGAPAAQALRLQTADGALFYAYRHEHPAVAATVVVRDPVREAVLVVRRGIEPFLGAYAFPGGFLEVGRESVEQAAARELAEETGVWIEPERLALVDVRSAPDRDPRDHVLDIGFYAEEPSAQARPLDETEEICWIPLAEVDALSLAFDHGQLWRRVRERFIQG